VVVSAASFGQKATSSGKQVRQVGHSFIRWFYEELERFMAFLEDFNG
jgi:hypothetical protein